MANASEVSICSGALVKLGLQPIISLADANAQARACNQVYATQRDALLRAHPWKFATKYVVLTPDVETPVFDFGYQFTLPSDYLKLQQESADPNVLWKLVGDKVYANDSVFELVYTARITDPTKFDSLFVEALEDKIAMVLAMPLTRQAKVYDSRAAQFALSMSEARCATLQESTVASETFEATHWTNSRL